ncbi:unnamed protein product [Schistosoma turkestanicum]|nr:unnamed protein product [Schistosoma turkestanicum]
MTYSKKIIAIKHSCSNIDNDTGEQAYLCTYDNPPEKCLHCGASFNNNETTIHQLLSPTITNAHNPIMFSSYPIARIVFILSDNSSSILSYHQQSNVNFHCGVVDSDGQVYHYIQQCGVTMDLIGWEQCIMINVADTMNCDKLTSSKWNETIHQFVNDDDYFNQSNDSETTNNHNLSSINQQQYDCLDFIIDIIKIATQNETVDRIQIAAWLSNQLDWIRLYGDLVRKLEEDPNCSWQIIEKFHQSDMTHFLVSS